jgi:hypothetical protein
MREGLTHCDTIAQRKRNPLGFASNANMSCDVTRLCPLDAKICQRVFAYGMTGISKLIK